MAVHLPLQKLLALLLAVGLAAITFDAAFARKKPRVKGTVDPPAVTYDHGTPIIMKGYRVPRVSSDAPNMLRDDDGRPRVLPRSSSGYVPPPLPSRDAGLPAPSLLQPPAPSPQPPPINSYGDRVTRCLHSAPFNAGVGNNPADRDAYVRSCAN